MFRSLAASLCTNVVLPEPAIPSTIRHIGRFPGGLSAFVSVFASPEPSTFVSDIFTTIRNVIFKFVWLIFRTVTVVLGNNQVATLVSINLRKKYTVLEKPDRWQ